MQKSPLAPDCSPVPYWWDGVAPVETGEPDLPNSVDVLIVGAGYTGLNAAIETARGGRTTLVLDAEQAGWGCSTRNGGQISTSIKSGYDELCRQHGKEKGYAIAREGHNALEWIVDFIRREKIDCDLAEVGRFHAAHNPLQFKKLVASIGTRPAGLEIPAEIVPRSEQHAVIGSQSYHGGLIYPRHCALQPAKYQNGLIERAMSAGAKIAAFCPALKIERNGQGFVVATGRGTVRARDVVIATNGYTGTITPWMRRRIIPIGSYVIATDALPAGLMDRLMPRDHIVSDTRKVVYYYRPSPDRSRIVFGGRVSIGETDTTRSGPLLHADLTKLFPELADVRVTHSWMGFVGYTFDTLAHAGKHDGMYYAMGYCGSGVSMASYLGMRTGQKVLGLAEGRTGFDDVRFQTRPAYNGRPWFLSASVMYYRWRDRQSW